MMALFFFSALLWPPHVAAQNLVPRDQVNGNLIQFNDNGAWCWYQDERAIIDAAGRKLVVGSVASSSGTGGVNRNGAVEAVLYDLNTGAVDRSLLYKAGYTDDHHAPGFLLRPDGKYLTVYAEHYDRYYSRYQIHNGSSWSGENRFDWTTIPGGTDYTIAYSNLCYLSAENRVYCFSRANHRTPNFIYSDDLGEFWSYGGELTTNTSSSYNKGYYKYWCNGVDRIDFIFTEEHPRDTFTSIYHGYVQNGKSYTSNGTLVDSDIYDLTFLPSFADFTLVFGDNTLIHNTAMRRCWNTDVMRYDDGAIATIITARTNQYTGADRDINPNHAFIYCRYDGNAWRYTYLGQAGYKMYDSEADYTGLAALCPDDPNIIYLSTHFDPRDNRDLVVREIFKGVTADHGTSWNWTPITWRSVRDNFRPIVPAWDKDNTALLWWRGSYFSAQSYDAAVVGLFQQTREKTAKMHYVDASRSNTFTARGNDIRSSGPDGNAGAVDGRWHERTGYGNHGSVLTSSETGGENAPPLKTVASPGAPGLYDVWVNFWAKPTADWRIQAGLELSRLQIFRSMACKQVQSGDHHSAVLLCTGQDAQLYQAYLGRVQVDEQGSIEAYVDDAAVAAGQTTALSGDQVRTWYDGISYALVESATQVAGQTPSRPFSCSLEQNYPNPFNPTTTIRFTLEQTTRAILTIFDIKGRQRAALLDQELAPGMHSVVWNAAESASGTYLCRLLTPQGEKWLRMILIR